MRATRVIIDLNVLRGNLNAIKRYVGPSVSIALSLKADGYGHGSVAVARAAEAVGIDTFGISNLDEAMELREAGIKGRILLYGLALPEEIPLLVREGIQCFVGDEEYIDLFAKEARKQGRIALLHLKVDTGMGRIGCSPEMLPILAEKIHRDRNTELGGICTHFPASNSTDSDFTREQLRIFKLWVDRIRERGIPTGSLHAANSDALLSIPDSHLDMVRPGLLAYGYYPEGIDESIREKVPVQPVMEFKTKVVFLKKVKGGTPIS